MISLEQVKLLESQVIKTIEYVDKVTEENNLLREKLASYQKRIDELEVLVQRFKEDQSRIEEGILSALNRLNQFEAEIKSSLSPEKFRDDTAASPAPELTQPETGDLPDPLSGQDEKDEDEEDETVELSLSGKTSPFEAEGLEENDVILEPETDDLPGDDEVSDETLNPGELDIF
jgi:chromosome segregation ATPase